MIVAGLDPGPGESALVVLDSADWSIVYHTCALNRKLLSLARPNDWDALAVEWIEPQGLRMTDELTETVLWTGRFVAHWGWWDRAQLVRPREIKKHLYGTCYGTDARKRAALVERFGAPGTKKLPGTLYGVKGHQWSALAVAVVAADRAVGRAGAL